MKVNIKDFTAQYLNLIPADIMAQFTPLMLLGEKESEIRDTVIEEMRIEQFYIEHPTLRPKTDWEVISLYSSLTDLLSLVINKEDNIEERTDELIHKAGIMIDKYKVEERSTSELENIYDKALWIKSEILG